MSQAHDLSLFSPLIPLHYIPAPAHARMHRHSRQTVVGPRIIQKSRACLSQTSPMCSPRSQAVRERFPWRSPESAGLSTWSHGFTWDRFLKKKKKLYRSKKKSQSPGPEQDSLIIFSMKGWWEKWLFWNCAVARRGGGYKGSLLWRTALCSFAAQLFLWVILLLTFISQHEVL